MDEHRLIEQMAFNAGRIAALVEGVKDEQARWKPTPENWSILEVMRHLWDEEREDFRVRLNLILHAPDQPWPPINPGGWVTERAYNSGKLAEALQGYLDEREASLAWLRGLRQSDWKAGVPAPWGGEIKAGDMLAAWAAHDLLHMRQLVELQRAFNVSLSAPYDSQYAGEW
jgi:hypothetical protein